MDNCQHQHQVRQQQICCILERWRFTLHKARKPDVTVLTAEKERIILEVFQNELEKVEDENCRSILTKVYQLFALSQIEKNKGWYLEQGYLEGVKTKAIRKLVNQLCLEVREESVFLVRAFGVPSS